MQLEHSEKYFKANKIIAWTLVVICISIACSLAAISGSHSFTNTYDRGRVCDVRGWGYPMELEPTDETRNYFWASTKEEPFNWNYLYLDLESDYEDAEIAMTDLEDNLQESVPETEQALEDSPELVES